jgi:hypothetical protein
VVAPDQATEETPEKAPKRTQFLATWDFLIPLSMPVESAPASGVVTGTSVQGASIELRYWWGPRLAVGALAGWHALGDRTTRTLTSGDATETGTVVTQVSSNEFLGRAVYTLADPKPMRGPRPKDGKKVPLGTQLVPHVGLGFGGAHFISRLDTGYELKNSERWYWAVAPELGLGIPTQFAPLVVAIRLHYLFGSPDGPEQVYSTLSLGAVFE